MLAAIMTGKAGNSIIAFKVCCINAFYHLYHFPGNIFFFNRIAYKVPCVVNIIMNVAETAIHIQRCPHELHYIFQLT